MTDTATQSTHTEAKAAAFTAPAVATVAGCIADVREGLADEKFLSQSRCVDSLLDCFNVSVRATVRTIIGEALAEITHVTIVRAERFRSMLDEIHLALQVDAAFDHLELGHV